MPKDYSNREIDTKHEAIMEKLKAIHEQTTLTNGRVTDLEKETAIIKGWISLVKGMGLAVTSSGLVILLIKQFAK